jgi:hypothetical protein
MICADLLLLDLREAKGNGVWVCRHVWMTRKNRKSLLVERAENDYLVDVHAVEVAYLSKDG